MDEEPDLSKFSEEEQRILRDVMSRAQDEDEKDRKDFRKQQESLSILESAISLRQREKSNVDLNSTCNICFQTKFADGIGHICETCQIRCCARCGVKVSIVKSNKKLWLCVLCRKKTELANKFGKYLKSDPAKPWGRSRSLEEEANAKRLVTTPLSAMTRRFPSALNITTPSLPFWGSNGEKKQQQQQQQPAVRPDPLPPRREVLQAPPRSTQLRCDPPQLNYPSPGGGDGGLQRRYTRRRSSLDTIRNDSLSSDQSENPPSAAPRPKPRKGGNGHRCRRSGSSGSEDEARSSPSSCQDSESDRVSLRKEKRPVRENRWPRSQEDSQLTTSVSDFMEVSNLIATAKEMHASSLKATAMTSSCHKTRHAAAYCLPSDFKTAMKQFTTDKDFAIVIDRSQDARSEDQFDIVGRNIAFKLRTLPKRQRIIAEKLINETLFEAELGTLNRNSKINVL